jgi:hypothetical protein
MRQTAVVLAAFIHAAVAAFSANISVAGAWEGKENGLPSVELKLRDDNGQISGTISFYFQTRGNNGKWHLDRNPPFTVPLLSPQLEGAVLRFETIHHRQHGRAELGPNNKYRVTFMGRTEARLQVFRYGAKEDASAPVLKLIRHE